VLIIRSIAFNILFYLNTWVYLVIAVPAFFMPYRAVVWVAKSWGRTNLKLLRVAGIKFELRGGEKIPQGALLVASKHQSAWETFALQTLFDNPLFILKRELLWIPFFGWLLWKGRMVAIDRRAGSRTLSDMIARACEELADGRQLIIFPEGTRRAAGAESKYKFGVAHVYEAAGVMCLPVALNSGVFWPRRSILRYPGTVVIEVLDPIPCGLDKNEFFARLQDAIEPATARLVAEAQRGLT
jgi:1-acyl-sn-glycerol-3-phosphate acyltransferase